MTEISLNNVEAQRCFLFQKSNDRALLFFALLSLLGIFFFPRYEFVANANIRLEDVSFVFLFSILACRILTGKFKLYIDLCLPLVYLMFPFFISLIRAITGEEWGYSFFVHWGKEFQYYIFFVMFYYFSLKGKTNAIFRWLIFLVLLNVVVGSYKIITQAVDYYGIGAMFFESSSSLSGQIYHVGAIIALLIKCFGNIQRRCVRNFISLLIVLSFVCCLATESKSSSIGVSAFFVIFYILRDISSIKILGQLLTKSIKWIMIFIMGVVFLYLMIYKLDYQKYDYVDLRRLRSPVESLALRYSDVIVPKLARLEGPVDYLAGVGYLGGQIPGRHISFGSAYDSQYIRNLLVLGAFGSLIWIVMLFRFGWSLREDKKLLIFYFALVGSYLAVGLGIESFQMSKSGPMFWIISGMLLGMAQREKYLKRLGHDNSNYG